MRNWFYVGIPPDHAPDRQGAARQQRLAAAPRDRQQQVGSSSGPATTAAGSLTLASSIGGSA
jgi:hypothetical protein